MYMDCFGPRNRRVMLASYPKIPAFSATHPPLGAAFVPYGTARHQSRARVDLIHHARSNFAGTSRPRSRARSGFAVHRPRRPRLRRPRPWEFRYLESGTQPYRRGPPSALSPVRAPLSSRPLSSRTCSGLPRFDGEHLRALRRAAAGLAQAHGVPVVARGWTMPDSFSSANGVVTTWTRSPTASFAGFSPSSRPQGRPVKPADTRGTPSRPPPWRFTSWLNARRFRPRSSPRTRPSRWAGSPPPLRSPRDDTFQITYDQPDFIESRRRS